MAWKEKRVWYSDGKTMLTKNVNCKRLFNREVLRETSLLLFDDESEANGQFPWDENSLTVAEL